MKYCYVVLLLLACCGPTGAEPTNYLSIYLCKLANKADVKAALSGQANLADITLEPEPLLADHDFVSYDTNMHIFSIKAETAKRLSNRLSPSGLPGPRLYRKLGFGYLFDFSETPFVLKAMNERICVGTFLCGLSSGMYGCPVIEAEKLFISESSTNDVGFFLERGYPGDECGVGAAPRKDKRIIAAVEKLFPITNCPSKNPLQ